MNDGAQWRVLAEGLAFPEGPVFTPDGALWFVELKGGNLGRFHEGRVLRIPTGGEPNGLAVTGDGRICFCDSGRCEIRRFDPATASFETLADRIAGEPLFKPNDLAFDSAGNLLFTCPGDSRHTPSGYVAVLRPAGTVERVASGFYFPNGLAFTPSGSHLIIAETRRQRLWRGRWDAEHARWLAPRPWASVGGTVGPDGMAFSADGLLHVAIYSGGAIKTVAPDGEIEEVIPTPGANPTNCAFDPSGRLGLVATEAERGELLSLPGCGPGAALFTPERKR